VIDPALIVLWTLALAMAAITAFLLRWAAEARTRVAAAVVLFLLGMMSSMLLGAAAYLLDPTRDGLVIALWLTTALMSLSVFPVFYVIVRHLPSPDGSRPAPATPWSAGAGYLGGVLGLVLLNELLMGAVFSAAAGGGLPAASAGFLGALAQTVNGPWFLFTMATEMALSAVLLRGRLPRPVVALFLAQALLMALSPPAFGVLGSGALVLVAGAAAMTGIIVYLMEYLYRHRQMPVVLSRYVLALLAVYALMMAGLYLWLVDGSGLVFAVSVLLEMLLFFDALLRPDRLSAAPGEPWLLRPHWTFGVLASIFVAELFMGAILDLALEPAIYAPALPSLALAGAPATVLFNALSNGFWFVALVTGSTWFLAMMGLEMGTLFYFKFRESRNRENRVRMVMTMVSYGAFATFFPSLYYSTLFPNALSGTQVPVLGWSMGLGSAPIVPSLFLVIFLTYAIFGIASVLFGRRAVCSVFCTAPLMYQGTTIDAMRPFNRSSRIGRKNLGSRLSSLYSATAGLTMAALVAVSFGSYFDQQGLLNVTILGADPSVFFFALSFSVAWYVLFVSIPYVGDYNCVTMGWCYTGLIAGAFQKVGFFKLKVRSKEVCKACTTLDCAKACPVALLDMPGHFRTKGEFRSSKCCGVGNCVGACPYGNLYIHDVRHWVAERWPRSHRPAEGVRLPMARSPLASAPRAPVPGASAVRARALVAAASPPAAPSGEAGA
jgi:polyferredoxin